MIRRGFTIIELLMVVALLGVILIAVTQLLGSSLVGAGKATALAQLKDSGQFAMSTIERTARNATRVTTCGTSLAFSVSQNGVTMDYVFSVSGDRRLQRSVDGAAPSFITDGAVRVTDFSCTKNPDLPGEPTVLLITLTLDKTGALEQSVVSQKFQTTVSLRTY